MEKRRNDHYPLASASRLRHGMIHKISKASYDMIISSIIVSFRIDDKKWKVYRQRYIFMLFDLSHTIVNWVVN